MDILLILLALLFIALKKTEWVLVIIMALCTDLFHAGSIVEHTFILPQQTDGALFLIILLLLFRSTAPMDYPEEYWKLNRFLYIFGGYLLLVTVIDIFFNHVVLLSIIRTSRHWLFFLFLYIAYHFQRETIQKALQITLYLVTFVSGWMLFEHLIGVDIFFESFVDSLGMHRAKLPTYLALFFSFLVFVNYFQFSKTKQYLFLGILLLSQLMTATRSIALALFLGVAICVYFCAEKKAMALCKLVGVVLVSFMIVWSIPALKTRFVAAQEEMSEMRAGSREVEGNTTFRLLVLAERYEYLTTKTQYYLFGVGNVWDRDFPNIFEIGLYDEERGRAVQLDTGDIVWPLIILRLGMIGLVLFILGYLGVIKLFFKTKENPLSIATIAYLLSVLLFTSFAGSYCGRGDFWILPMLCLVLMRKNNIDKKYPVNSYF